MNNRSHTHTTQFHSIAGMGWSKNVCKLCDANEYWLFNCIGHGNGRYTYLYIFYGKYFVIFNFSTFSIYFSALCIYFPFALVAVCLLLASLDSFVCSFVRLLALQSSNFLFHQLKWLLNCMLLLVTSKMKTITGFWFSVYDTLFEVTVVFSCK